MKMIRTENKKCKASILLYEVLVLFFAKIKREYIYNLTWYSQYKL